MNFFAQQEAARKQTLRLLIIYVLAIGFIVAGLVLVYATVMTLVVVDPQRGIDPLLWITRHPSSVLLVAVGIVLFIGLASLYRIISTRGGGGSVARSLGGTRVSEDTRDPAARRLVNVVEEMAIASGMPVPEIYVLENESGINAFAAGYDANDAAIAVTRGSLDVFDRQELQGVIGHEFSHILNGDMRLNMRLLGPLFGIMLISMMGRVILRGMGSSRTRSSKQGAGGTLLILVLGVGLSVIGYIGNFAGQAIKAAVSRQREFLADSSAVQFTRETGGIKNALKKIAAWQYGSHLANEQTEEVSHMLFADGFRASRMRLLSTHPPLQERLAKLGYQWSNSDIAKLAVQLGGKPSSEEISADAVANFSSASITPADIASEHPAGDIQQAAGELLSTIPPGLYQAAHDVNTVLPTIAALLLDPGEAYRDQQLAIMRDNDSLFDTQEVLDRWATVSNLTDRLRLPLIELAMPAVRRLTWQRQADFLQLVEALITIDNTINSFEYLLSRLLMQNIRESSRPRRQIKSQRSTKLTRYEYELGVVFSVLAQEGHTVRSDAMRAYRAGMTHLSSHHTWPSYHVPSDWPVALDSSLQRLDALRPLVKEELLESLKVTVRFDGKQRASEAELLRVIAALLHVSLPLDYVPGVN